MQRLDGDPRTKEYWNDRVKKIPDPKDMLFLDGRREDFWQRVRYYLRGMEPGPVLDLCCGYGQFSRLFATNDYLGIDFSKEMIKLAKEKNPNYQFIEHDVKTFIPEPVDVIFEVNSLRSLGMSAEDFITTFKPYAKRAVACLEADQFIIYQIYDNK